MSINETIKKIMNHPFWARPFWTLAAGVMALIGGVLAARNPETGPLYAAPVLIAGVLLVAAYIFLPRTARRRMHS